MNDYRPLTTEEIEVLKHNDCWAEDWTSVNVSEDFKPNFMHRVMLYGEINIGSFNKNVEVSQGLRKAFGHQQCHLAQCNHRRRLSDRKRRQFHQQLYHWR